MVGKLRSGPEEQMETLKSVLAPELVHALPWTGGRSDCAHSLLNLVHPADSSHRPVCGCPTERQIPAPTLLGPHVGSPSY